MKVYQASLRMLHTCTCSYCCRQALNIMKRVTVFIQLLTEMFVLTHCAKES